VTAALGYGDVPMEPSDFGRRLYAAGRRLVTEHGLGLDRVLWDADEVLWDWLMSMGDLLRKVPTFPFTGDVGHVEYLRVKPGVLELIWGMSHAAREVGGDPHLRLWTNGYPWRVWAIGSQVPGLATLLGPPAKEGGAAETFEAHPRVFYRSDYARAATRLADPDEGPALLDAMPARTAELLADLLPADLARTDLKLPELAPLAGRGGFGGVEVLVDDTRRNVERFVQAGRRGVRLATPRRRAVLGHIPNTVWRAPWHHLAALGADLASGLAEALELVARDEGPALIEVKPGAPVLDYPALQLTIRVPDDRIREQWIEPHRALRRRGWRS